ncbi:glycosyltransferase family 4 protein [Paenibacillus tarimensis]|uniref:glycosyltransferase family 4 protein n=1 Tax=Paenibacillus tarimensis TaxID=416012 RepID=UPI001F31CDF0|nr:glycosyltransferase family 4 protein [Paenibacillus tarimensis]MCF2945550.1 glycosyltransferase family 4 protein [Paenibacillus tarimensis]
MKPPLLLLPQVNHYSPPTDARTQSGSRHPLTVLYVVHTFYPESYTGTEKFVLNLARAMKQLGHNVKILTYSSILPADTPSDGSSIVRQEYEHEGIPVIAYRSLNGDAVPPAAADHPSLTAFADYILTREQPSIIHIAHPMRGIDFMQSANRLGIPYILTLTDYWYVCPKSILLRNDQQLCSGPENGLSCKTYCQIPDAAERLQALTPLLQAASQILSPSVFLASFIKHVVPSLPIEVVHHGMRHEALIPNSRVYQKDSPLTFMYGGSLNEHKGVHVLIKAMSFVTSKRIKLLIYGSGSSEYTALLHRMAQRDKRIIFRGTYTEAQIPSLYQEADLAVVPSIWYENHPLALHEALASHVPVITSNIGGMSEKVIDGLNGYTFRAADARHLAQRINMLAHNPALLNPIKDNIRNMPLPSMDTEASSYEAIYQTHAR